ncbi:MAG: hypothetical protein RLZZ267_570 [Bacillota bacterium]|jgi:hypothetical protein
MKNESRIYPLTIAQVQWQMDDLQDAFRMAGIEPTKEQLNQLAVDDNILNFVQDLLKVAGTQVLADMIKELYESSETNSSTLKAVH